MLKPVVCLISDFEVYLAAVRRRFSGVRDVGYDMLCLRQVSELDHIDPAVVRRIALVLAPKCEHEKIRNRLNDGRIALRFPVQIVDLNRSVPTPDAKGPRDDGHLSVYDSATTLRELIRRRLAAVGTRPSDHTPCEATHRPPDEPMVATALTFSPSVRRAIARRVVDDVRERGDDLLYLPLMPLYMMSTEFTDPVDGHLGHFLLQLSERPTTDSDELGSYLYMHDEGFYTFHLPPRADDLIQIPPPLLRELIARVRTYVETRAIPTRAYIDMDGMELERRTAVAVLCDLVMVETPCGPHAAERAARHELTLMLNRLPLSCRIREWPSEGGFLVRDTQS